MWVEGSRLYMEVKLRSGGTVSLNAVFDHSTISEDDLQFVLRVLDELRLYESKKPT